MSEDGPTYSDHIYRLLAIIDAAGVRVNTHATHLTVHGRCHYPTDPEGTLIEINEPSAKIALMVLAHEWGHYLSWLELHDAFPDLDTEKREFLALWFGWETLKELSADITREEWLSFHYWDDPCDS